MGAQLGLPAALRARGLTVEVVPGWETRSAGSFNPKGAVCHWTAGPAGTTKRPSLSICTNGRKDLPGPLCNVYLDRNGVAVVVAAGRANHAGAGVWRGVTGNSSFFGTECEAAGPKDFTAAQRWAYPRVNAAFCDLGGFGADMVCGHSEYATPKGRKTDINDYPMTTMRAQVATILSGANPVQEDDLPSIPELLNYPAYTGGPTISEVLMQLDKVTDPQQVLSADGKPVPGRTIDLPLFLRWFDNNVASLTRQNEAQSAQIAAQGAAIQALSTAVAQGTGDPAAVERMVTEHVDAAVSRLRITAA